MHRPAVLLACVVAVPVLLACEQPAGPPTLQYETMAPQGAKPVYRLAVHPLHNPSKLSEAYQPLIAYLNRKIPEAQFELEASRDYADYERKLRNREPELLIPNPWQTLVAIKAGYRVVAMAGDANDFKGIFIVREDSGIRSLKDFKGKSISYPSPTALAACIMPQYHMHRQGLDVNRDIVNVFVGSQESSILSVYLGQTQVGVTWPPPWRMFQRDYPAEAAKLRVIMETAPLINNSVMARDDVPSAMTARIRLVLLDLGQTAFEQDVLASMSMARFHPADDASYDTVRDFIAVFERQVRPVESR